MFPDLQEIVYVNVTGNVSTQMKNGRLTRIVINILESCVSSRDFPLRVEQNLVSGVVLCCVISCVRFPCLTDNFPNYLNMDNKIIVAVGNIN